MAKRARSLTPYERHTSLCDDETCVRKAAFGFRFKAVFERQFCAIHAKAEALAILLNEEFEDD